MLSKPFLKVLQFNQEGELVYWNGSRLSSFVMGVVFNLIIFAYFTERKLCIGSEKAKV